MKGGDAHPGTIERDGSETSRTALDPPQARVLRVRCVVLLPKKREAVGPAIRNRAVDKGWYSASVALSKTDDGISGSNT